MRYLHENLNRLIKFLGVAIVISLAFVAGSAAQEAPDVLVKRVSQEVLDIARKDKDIQGGNRKHVFELVEAKVFPHVDFQRTTALAAGRFWREATPEQQQQLANEFRQLLLHTYSGALSQVKDQKLVFKPLRAGPSATSVVVRSEVVQAGDVPIQLDYRLEKTPSGWKIYDLNVLGAWLVETYKSTFASEIGKSGIDGLIKTLAEKNKKLAASRSKVVKPS